MPIGSALRVVPPCGAIQTTRGVPDGPDDDIDNLPLLLHGALAVAARRVRIATPYFLPDDGLLRALQVAALRAVSRWTCCCRNAATCR
jgi:cardiolipin synthase